MDFSRNTVLKEHYTFFVGDADGRVAGGEHGIYNRDVRLLSRYAWRLEPRPPGRMQTLLVASPRTDTLYSHAALFDGPSQRLAVRRTLRLHAGGLSDELRVENTSLEPGAATVRIDVAGDFADLFEVRGWHRPERAPPTVERSARRLALRYRASDGVDQGVRIDFDETAAVDEGGASWELDLPPGAAAVLRVEVEVDNPLDAAPVAVLGIDEWRAGFGALPEAPAPTVLERAIADLRGLLLFTPQGPVVAAGIPWFVAAFGRDALLTAHMLLPYRLDVAAGTLRYLAHHQGRASDPSRAEEPGKIMHELRFGELTRTGRVPHGPYYGSVDATPLFVALLGAYLRAGGEPSLVRELRPAWEAALSWIVERGDADGDGFVEYTPAGEALGLSVQSWKDSHDSMSHADGTLAKGALAVCEVQGYTFAAYRAAAECYRALGAEGDAAPWSARAAALAEHFHRSFWLEDQATYAMALDGDKRPLAVKSSDAGQLLWCGIVPVAAAPRLVATLFGDELWSGWGIRTLGRREVRYNPLSYHNGSVWPHDTALIAAGLARYGFLDEARRLRLALFELADAQPDLRLPELVGGYGRGETPPVPYPSACRPQGWDAGALVYLLNLEGEAATRPARAASAASRRPPPRRDPQPRR